jgi:hypothetical protein
MFKVGDRVRVKRDIYRLTEGGAWKDRKRKLYAEKNQEGIIEEVFRAESRHSWLLGNMHAKVRIDLNLKTLRLTSIEKI